jgi:hypothetical protein
MHRGLSRATLVVVALLILPSLLHGRTQVVTDDAEVDLRLRSGAWGHSQSIHVGLFRGNDRDGAKGRGHEHRVGERRGLEKCDVLCDSAARRSELTCPVQVRELVPLRGFAKGWTVPFTGTAV